MARLDDSHEAAEQVAFADTVLLNKTDLVSSDELARVEARIRAINPTAAIHRTERCQIPVADILGRHAFDLDRILAIEPNFLGQDDHQHDDAISSVSLNEKRPLDLEKFNAWMGALLRERGQDILRSKGILYMQGSAHRFVFQAVHMLIEADKGKRWEPTDTRDSKLVFIGRGLKSDDLRTSFEACTVT